MKHIRTETTVVMGIAAALCSVEATGIAIEPIATIEDPDNKIEGDYSVRACFTVEKPASLKDKRKMRYCLIFEAAITMDNFMTMAEDRFMSNMVNLVDAAVSFRDKDTSEMDVHVTTDCGTTNMGRVRRNAQKVDYQ